MNTPIILTEEILKAFPCLKDVGLVEAFFVDGELHTTTTSGGVREYGNLLGDWAEDFIDKMKEGTVEVSDVVYHEKSGKTFEVKSIRGNNAMCYEIDSNLKRIPRKTRNGVIERLIDKSISYKVSLINKNGLSILAR